MAAGLPGAPGPAPRTRRPGPAHPRAAPAPAEPPLPSALRVLPSQFGTYRSSARGWGDAAGTKTLPSPPPPRSRPHPLPVTRWDAAVLYRKLWAAASGERARHFTTALSQRCNPPGDERSGEGTWLGAGAGTRGATHGRGRGREAQSGAGYSPTGSSLASCGTTSGNAGSHDGAAVRQLAGVTPNHLLLLTTLIDLPVVTHQAPAAGPPGPGLFSVTGP